jgi:hypothetical protein
MTNMSLRLAIKACKEEHNLLQHYTERSKHVQLVLMRLLLKNTITNPIALEQTERRMELLTDLVKAISSLHYTSFLEDRIH